MGDGEKICRQIVKYSYTWGLNFVSVCDGICLILGILRGERTRYYNAQTIPRPVSAQCSFVTQAENMKRTLYIWVKLALKSFLQGNGFIEQDIR